MDVLKLARLTSVSAAQPLNKDDISVILSVLKALRSSVCNELHLLKIPPMIVRAVVGELGNMSVVSDTQSENIFPIFATLVNTKFDRSIVCSEPHPENILFIVVTFDVSKRDTSTDCIDEQL